MTATLAAELNAFKDAALARAPAERVRMVQQHIDGWRDRQIVATALRIGEIAPNFVLPNQLGAHIGLAERLRRGPVIVVFYRGGWCPYCSIELRAYQRLQPRIAAAGVSLLAISPQTPDATLATAGKNELAFDVLSDTGAAVARGFGIAFTLPPELQELYRGLGTVLPDINGDDSWTVPVPATFVIGTDARVRVAHVDVDYRVRLEPEEALQACHAEVDTA